MAGRMQKVVRRSIHLFQLANIRSKDKSCPTCFKCSVINRAQQLSRT
jgi:hypothetical protein